MILQPETVIDWHRADGARGSIDMSELKFLLQRDKAEPPKRLLESAEYRATFHARDLKKLADASPFAARS